MLLHDSLKSVFLHLPYDTYVYVNIQYLQKQQKGIIQKLQMWLCRGRALAHLNRDHHLNMYCMFSPDRSLFGSLHSSLVLWACCIPSVIGGVTQGLHFGAANKLWDQGRVVDRGTPCWCGDTGVTAEIGPGVCNAYALHCVKVEQLSLMDLTGPLSGAAVVISLNRSQTVPNLHWLNR